METIKLANAEGSSFRYRIEEDGEVYGFVESHNGCIVPKTAGWYRTTDPLVAAGIAREKAGYGRIEWGSNLGAA